MNDRLDWQTGVKDSLPVLFSYITIALAFGIIGKAAGLSILQVVLISAIDFGGAAQFVMITMLAAHSGLWAIVVAVFLVNSRMILMSTTLAPYFNRESMLKNVLIGSLLTDESFAVGMNKLTRTDGRLSFPWFNAANLMGYAVWVLGTYAGAVVGDLIPNPEKFGVGFAITAMFIGLLYLQMIADKSIKFGIQLAVVAFMLVAIYFGMVFIPGSLLVLVATIAGCFFGVVIKHAFQ
ncbi:AzlC family ABC transporter permease [Leuconostocaceae bacterium ESL0723]|nr:AzlC family ABC transporter permease [Leuconostocaceae bacterium ESL0723]